MSATVDSVLDFWFGDRSRPSAEIAAAQAGLWWGKSESTDAAIRTQFGQALAVAGSGGLDEWLSTPEGLLAAIIVIDQFSRNAHRDSGEAFALDSVALGWCKKGIEQGVDQALRPIERLFFYLPLEHSEDMEDQNQCVVLMDILAGSVDESSRETFAGFADYARQHQRIIARFGRYPHRNALLGRESTEEELAFLQEPGSSF